MRIRKMTSLIASASLGLLVACTSHHSVQAKKLFEFRGSNSLTELQAAVGVAPYLNALVSDPANEDIRPVTVDTSLVSPDTKSLTVSLNEKDSVTFQLRRADPPAPGMVGWVGDVSTDRRKKFTSTAEGDFDKDWISLVLHEGNLIGSINFDGMRYELQPVGRGQHVLVKVNESKLPPEAEPLLENSTSAPDTTSGYVPKSQRSIIRVMFVTTEESRARYADYKGTLANALQSANQYMINSKVDITYELAGYYDGAISEQGKTFKEMVYALRQTDQPFGKAVGERRDALRAHLVSILLVNPEYCGWASITSNKSNAFSGIACFGSLGHELGHNLGADHNWHEGDNERNPPYMFGYRYQAGTPRFSTQMSYACSPACPRIPYHSNPRVTYEGIPVGTAEHHDVARRFNERRETVEGFYPPVLEFILYDGSNFNGRSCQFVQGIGSSTDVRAQCGEEWGTIVSSAKVIGMAPGVSVKFTHDKHAYESFLSKTYSGILPVYQFGDYPDVDVGIEWSSGGGSINNMVDGISSSR
ncbi:MULTISPECIES: reprolysin-like metallopeptidase [Pseudomonas]|uniref:Metallopeptidase n=1 Tax=Pseudomonas asiatica TaxID=2219225 RepID=A0A9X4D8C7_9PSED|nr:metallopeptidase [Pseudomonas asiatica]MEE1902503.1 metallopeptidase [Pseudomonas inefficax]MDD2106846.1 metallopeptidase [Pseudomonas asiatica]MDD2111854.1 metallopeptidase [Pseudomonas asiatica]MEE1909454.1 metallopeptidase [Pseudomonas inefficax]MEE1985269.1 metallopeptidase [Pseudomonas inefficax]